MKNDMTRIPKSAAAMLLALALNGCGGGSSGGLTGTTPPPETFDLQTGISGLVANGQSSNVTLSGTAVVNGTSVPFTGTATLTLAAGVSGTFNGEGALSQTETISGTVTAAGATAPYTSSVVDYYATGNDAFLGETGSSEYDVAQTAFTYPASVVAGDSGVLGTTTNYTDSSMGTTTGTTQVSYTVTAVTSTASDATPTVMVAITSQIDDTNSNPLETDVTNYSLTDGGVLTLVSATVQNSTESLTVTVQ
jgi:hypothetical protein